MVRNALSGIKKTLYFSLLDTTLLTGRKNQIRVHLAEAGHPVAGDAKYGIKRDRAPRMALHARTLSFPHPHDGRHRQLVEKVVKFQQKFEISERRITKEMMGFLSTGLQITFWWMTWRLENIMQRQPVIPRVSAVG